MTNDRTRSEGSMEGELNMVGKVRLEGLGVRDVVTHPTPVLFMLGA